MPATLRNHLDEYASAIRIAEASKYHRISNGCTEVFLFHHGLRMLDPRIRIPLRNKSFIDIGQYTGDSALVLSESAKDVSRIEPSRQNFAVLNRILADNPFLSANVCTYHMAMSDSEGTIHFTGGGGGGMISSNSGEPVEMITIDGFVQRNNLSMGFLKADVEGHALAVVKGAAGTITRDRPVFSFSLYHDFTEMYNVSVFLMDLLSDYYFEWHMENSVSMAFFELSLFGRPRQAWED
jgi:FkbM family methyltransferase